MLNSLMRLAPGMYILRHPKGGLCPLSISVAPSTPAAALIERLATSSTRGNVLRDGSDCIVLLVTVAPVDILVTAFLAKEGDTVPALRVDQIGLDAACTPTATAHPPISARSAMPSTDREERQSVSTAVKSPATTALEVAPHGLSLIGHIERLGDTVSLPGRVLGDATSDLRIEGFQVAWPDRPDGVDLAYSIAVEGAGALPIVNSGKYCGTRGEARRVVGVTFALVGPNAGQFELQGAAWFTGGFNVPVRAGVTLSGPTGMEHLTALKLGVARRTLLPPVNPWLDSNITRTFKAQHASGVDLQESGNRAA